MPLAAPTVRLRPPPTPRPVAAPGRVRVQRRAGVAVGVGLVTIAAIQVGTGLAIRAEQLPLRDPVYFDKLALLRRHPAFFTDDPGRPTTMLFVGSSRTLNAVDAAAAGRQLSAALGRPVQAFNFAQAGAGPVTNAVYVRRLIAAGARPDFVLIEVHPVFLAGQRSPPPEARWLLPFRLRPDELPVVRGFGFPIADPPTHGPRGLIAPLYEFRFIVLDRYAPGLLLDDNRLAGGHPTDDRGFVRAGDVLSPARRAALTARVHSQYADHLPGYRPTGPGVAALRDPLDRCRDAGWRAGLVLLPESAEFRGWYPPAGLAELDSVLAGLAAEYGVPVFDARGWVPDELNADGHHLTGPGADVLTDRLARDALAPWIGTRP